jgi:hypothetical protein
VCDIIALIRNVLPDGGQGRDDGFFYTGGGTDEVDVFVSGPDAGDQLWVSEYYNSGTIPMAPRTATLGPTTYGNCYDCIIYSSGCMYRDDHNCAKSFLAQGGAFQVDQQTLGDAGVLKGSVTSLYLVEWQGIGNDPRPDGPVDGGTCLYITRGDFNGVWP